MDRLFNVVKTIREEDDSVLIREALQQWLERECARLEINPNKAITPREAQLLEVAQNTLANLDGEAVQPQNGTNNGQLPPGHRVDKEQKGNNHPRRKARG